MENYRFLKRRKFKPPIIPINKHISVFLLMPIFSYLHFWLCWVFIAMRVFLYLQCEGFSLWWLLLWWSTGSRAVIQFMGSVVEVPGL